MPRFFQVTLENIKSIVQRLLSHLVPPSQDSDAPTRSSTTFPSAAETLAQATAPIQTSSTAATAINPNQDPAYRRILSQRIITICSQLAVNSHSPSQTTSRFNYDYDENEAEFDFGWYTSVLVDLTYVAPASVDTGVGSAIRDQLLDVAMRVSDPSVRKRSVELMARLLGDEGMLDGIVRTDDTENGSERGVSNGGGEEEVLWAAAWICGEFCSSVDLYIFSFRLLITARL